MYACHANAHGLVANPQDFMDDEFHASGALEPINAQEAYARGYTGKDIVVAILDTGLHVQHPEFSGRVTQPYSYDPERADWDVSDSMIDEKTGKLMGHGTLVTGIIGAARDGIGMHGVAYESLLMPIHGDFDQDWLGLDRAVDTGAQVLNGSYGPLPDSEDVAKHQIIDADLLVSQHANMLRRAAAADIVMVFAAGNSHGFNDFQAAHSAGYGMFHLITPEFWESNQLDPFYRFIRSDDNITDGADSTYTYLDFNDPLVRDLDLSDLAGSILSVVAVAPDGNIAGYSNRCGAAWHYCVAAPGGDLRKFPDPPYLWSTHPEPSHGYYHAADGTSLATPVVSGAAAVIRQVFPYMTARQAIETLLTTTNSQGRYADRDIYGRGLLDLGKAVLGPGEFGAEGFPKLFEVDTAGYDSTFANHISGQGGLRKSGAGTLRLIGHNHYSGPTLVDGGRLAVDGAIRNSRLKIGTWGTLSGVGTVGPTTVYGRVAPGGSIGTLTFVPIGSDPLALRTKSGSTLEIDLDGNGHADTLKVQGDAELSGGNVLLRGLSGSTLGRQFTFLEVAGEVSGPGLDGFVHDDYAFIDLGLHATSLGYDVSVNRNDTRFAELGKTRNQRHAGAGIEASGVGTLPYETLIILQNASEAPQYYEQFSGEVHASLHTTMLADTQMVQQSVITQLNGPRHNQAQVDNKGGIWSQTMASWGRYGGAGIAHDARRSSSGLLFGRDFALGDESRLGLALGYTHSRTRAENRNQGMLDGWHFMVYGDGGFGPIKLRAGLSHSQYKLATTRNIQSADLGKHRARYRGNATALFAQASMAVPLSKMVLEPFAGFGQTWLRTHRFRESGLAGLAARSANNRFSQSELGVRGHWQFETRSGELNISTGASWLHTFGQLSPKTRIAHQGSASYSQYGVPVARNALRLEAKAHLARNTRTSLELSYHAEMGSKVRDHGLRLLLSHRF